MDSNPPELNPDIKSAYIPKTISSFLRELSMIGNISERLSKLNEFVKRLEEELMKIVVFKRELPLCMLLINDAIVALKDGAMQCTTSEVRSVMEEFIPLKRDSDDDDDDAGVKLEMDCGDKKNWMSSAQLWSCDGYSSNSIKSDKKQKSVAELKERTEEDDSSATNNLFRSCKYNKNGGGAFMPFKGYSGFPAKSRKENNEVLSVPGLSLMTPGIKTPKAEPGSMALNSKSNSCRTAPPSSTNVQSNVQSTTQLQQASRKQRRCWSPELHRRFVNALQQLGGSQVATPKQIRDLMQVDGLTNDEVKSHLQKYRLHTRRLPANTSNANSSPANQPIVLEGLWMSQDQYGDSSTPNTSQSGSPQGPLQMAGTVGGNSTTGGDSIEDEEDGKSESYNWKGQLHKPNEDDV